MNIRDILINDFTITFITYDKNKDLNILNQIAFHANLILITIK